MFACVCACVCVWVCVSVSSEQVRCDSDNMVAASNCAVEAAFDDGASYWYRLNDDTAMVTPNWLRDMPVILIHQSSPSLPPSLPPTAVYGHLCGTGLRESLRR